jgi:hypothetical protein
MNFLSAIFGAPRAVDAVAETVKTGASMLDNAFYTDQEKAEHQLKAWDVWLKIQATTAGENSIRSITRRILAWAIIGTFLFLLLAALLLYPISTEWSTVALKLTTETQLGWLTVAVGVFYFGTYGLGTYMKGDKK